MAWDKFHQIEASTAVNCITMHKRTEMYSEPDIQNLDNLRPEPERSSLTRRTRNGIPTVKPLHLLLAPFVNSTDTSTREELSEAFDAEVVLNDDALGRSRHERRRGQSGNLKRIIIFGLWHSKLILKPIKVRPDGPLYCFHPKRY